MTHTRRNVLRLCGASVALVTAGCVGGSPIGSDSTATSETATTEAHSNSESDPSTTTDECGWPQFCKGSTIVEVIVSSNFSGEVVLEAGCRDEDFEVQPGESKTIIRQVDAETCNITLYIDTKEAHTYDIADYETQTLEVDSDGEVQVSTVVL